MSWRHRFEPRGRPYVGVVQTCAVCGLQRTLRLVHGKGPRVKRGLRFRVSDAAPWRLSALVCIGPPAIGADAPDEIPVTHDELDAPDGAIVDGYQRIGDTWRRMRDGQPFEPEI